MNNKLIQNSLVDMVNYQKDAVVSKTIIEKNTALIQILDGEVEIRVSTKPHHLKQGEIIVMPANEPHSLKAVSKFKMLLTMIKS